MLIRPFCIRSFDKWAMLSGGETRLKYVSSLSSILVNGWPKGFFKSRRGLR